MRNRMYILNILRHLQKLTRKMSSTMQIDHSVYYAYISNWTVNESNPSTSTIFVLNIWVQQQQQVPIYKNIIIVIIM